MTDDRFILCFFGAFMVCVVAATGEAVHKLWTAASDAEFDGNNTRATALYCLGFFAVGIGSGLITSMVAVFYGDK